MSILSIIVIIIVILLAVTLHEAMHAFAGYWLGDDTARLSGRLTLNPLAHLDPFGSIILPGFLVFLNITGVPAPIFGAAKPVPFNPNRVKYGDWGAALVALAGPMTNFLFALIGGLALRFSPISDLSTTYAIAELFVVVNLGFFVFNMIPFPPLDGSRVLYAISPESVRDVLRRIESGGLMFVFLFIILFSGSLGSVSGGGIEFFYELIVGTSNGML